MAKLIKSWDELVGLRSDEYYLDIDEKGYSGWIRKKTDDDFMEYLGTHTFYGRNYKCSSVLLQEYGFDVQLKNWDSETEEVDYRDQWLWGGKCEHCRRKEYCTTECKAAKRWKEHLETLEQIRRRYEKV